MRLGPDITRAAALIGDPGRANMLLALMDGCALTARELADEAGVTPSTASSHLAKLRSGGLISERKEGRNRYYAIAGSAVADLLEQHLILSERLGHLRSRPGSRAPALKCSRVCYDHLAGTMAVWMYAQLRSFRFLAGTGERLRLTRKGQAFVSDFGIEIEIQGLNSDRERLCRPCRDWSEQSDHLGGILGAAFLDRFLALGWARRIAKTRIVDFTPPGERHFRRVFGSGAL